MPSIALAGAFAGQQVATEDRVLVLGSDGYGRAVTAFKWSNVPPFLNVADYDVVVLDFAVLQDLGRHYNASKFPTAEQFARLIFGSRGVVVAIGDPRERFEWLEMVNQNPVPSSQSVTWWLPVELPVKEESGESIRMLDADWAFWFERLAQYSWHFWGQPEYRQVSHGYAAGVPGASGFAGSWGRVLAATSYGAPLGVVLTLRTDNPTIDQADVVWLPRLPELAHDEAVSLLLREQFELPSAQPRPDWIVLYPLPRETVALERLDHAEAALSTAEQEVADAQSAVLTEARFARLLYEQGKDALEPVVREALAELGGIVSDAPSDREDARLTDPRGRPAIVEIKGRRGPLKLDDVRQLNDWIQSARFEEGWDGKGIIVANIQLEVAPHERGDDLVGPQAAERAERAEFAILLTTQLFEAIRSQQRGELDHDAFWDAIFSATGVTNLPHPAPSP